VYINQNAELSTYNTQAKQAVHSKPDLEKASEPHDTRKHSETAPSHTHTQHHTCSDAVVQTAEILKAEKVKYLRTLEILYILLYPTKRIIKRSPHQYTQPNISQPVLPLPTHVTTPRPYTDIAGTQA
jgi:hypothetical protein